jgi:hypothetical protein
MRKLGVSLSMITNERSSFWGATYVYVHTFGSNLSLVGPRTRQYRKTSAARCSQCG